MFLLVLIMLEVEVVVEVVVDALVDCRDPFFTYFNYRIIYIFNSTQFIYLFKISVFNSTMV